MKRLFYSTIAVLAFSVSGMANTIELEKVDTTLDTTFSEKDKECMSYARAAVREESAYYGIVMSKSEFNEAFAAYYNGCVDAKKRNEVLLDPVFVG